MSYADQSLDGCPVTDGRKPCPKARCLVNSNHCRSCMAGGVYGVAIHERGWAPYGEAAMANRSYRSATHSGCLCGVGCHLKRLLRRLRLFGKAGCQCDKHAAEMNRRGPDWCTDNIDTIVGWMRKAAKKRGLPFTSRGARILIRLAIHRGRRSWTGFD